MDERPGIDLDSFFENTTAFLSPNKQSSHNASELLVGIGWNKEGEAESSPGVILNNKYPHSPYRSVSQLVAGAEEAAIARWREKLALDVAGDTSRSIFLEDLSPDTCLSILLLLDRATGAGFVPRPWIDYATRWELGDTRSTGLPFQSWGCRQSALAHSYLSGHREGSDITEGLRAGLNYLAHLIKKGIAPDEIPDTVSSLEHNRAGNYLTQDYLRYQQNIDQAIRLQLLLPLSGSDRKAFADCLLTTELEPIGTGKAFIRSDQENTFFGHGFGVMGIHRPQATGTGNDMVVSVDPTLGIHLEELWNRLEALENERWAGNRPSDAPRVLESYPDGNGPNQPWWDDHGRYTMVAAPKRLEAQGEPGSKLAWKDVIEALWDLYGPGNELYVTPLSTPESTPVHLHDLAKTTDEQAGKTFLAAKIDMTSSKDFFLSPTLKRYFAACAASAGPGPIALKSLPEDNNFDFIQFPGAFGCFHKNGVVLLDDWTNERIDFQGCETEFHKLTERLHIITRYESRINGEIQGAEDAVSKGVVSPASVVNRLSEIKITLHKLLYKTGCRASDPSVIEFRQTLEARWGMASRHNNLFEKISQLDEIIQNFTDVRTNRLINALTIYGFPLAFFAPLLDRSMENFDYMTFTGFEPKSFLAYLGLSTASVLLLKFWAKRTFFNK